MSTSRQAPAVAGIPGPLAKLTRPRPRAVVARDRLLLHLDERLVHPVTWVVGPLGAGKTSLLSTYAEARKCPTLWYQIVAGDVDVATFFHYLRQAASGFPETRGTEPLPALMPEYLPDLAGFTRRFFRALFARLPRPAILVLDDYHALPAATALHGVIASAFAELPEGVGCLVASRVAPPSEFARLIANRVIVDLDWQDLRLTEEETAAIARSRNISDPAFIAAAHQRAAGWVAGLILLVDQSAAGRVLAAPALAPSSTALYNYCAEVFESSVSAEMREALLSIAVLPGVTGRAAIRLTGNEHAERMLQDLRERSLFVDCRSGSEPTYHLHALFRGFLQEFLRRNHPAEERLARLRQAADALHAFGESEQAATLYGEAGCWDKAAEIVLGLAPALLMQGRWQTLHDRITALPEAEVTARPWLQYWLGASRMVSDIELARATLVAAYEAFARRRDWWGRAWRPPPWSRASSSNTGTSRASIAGSRHWRRCSPVAPTWMPRDASSRCTRAW